jgi:putative salt-induced outer membrane protein YdiY
MSIILAGALLLAPLAGRADTVTLKNGDHLTGTVTQLLGGKLTISTSYAGALNISFDEVTEVKLDKPLLLPLEDRVNGKKVEISAIDRTATGFDVTTATGTQTFASGAISTLRTAAAQEAYEATLHPNLSHGWAGSANVSLGLARGNASTTSLGTGVNLARPTLKDKTSLYYNSLYSHDSILHATTANATGAGIRYDRNLNPKVFTFATADFAVDALQFLDLRSVLGGGFGWHAVNNPKQQFDVLGGVVWTHENYSSVAVSATNPTFIPAETNSFAALDLGQQYTRKIGKASMFTEQAYIFPDLGDTGQYRFTLNSSLSTKISSFLSWQTAATDVYVTNPQAGTKDNDLLITTGLGISFTRK